MTTVVRLLNDPRLKAGPAQNLALAPALPASFGVPMFVPVPRDQWPKWASWVESGDGYGLPGHLLRAGFPERGDADLGVGDTARRVFARLGGEQYKRLRKLVGLPCRCPERAEEWNRRFPY